MCISKACNVPSSVAEQYEKNEECNSLNFSNKILSENNLNSIFNLSRWVYSFCEEMPLALWILMTGGILNVSVLASQWLKGKCLFYKPFFNCGELHIGTLVQSKCFLKSRTLIGKKHNLTSELLVQIINLLQCTLFEHNYANTKYNNRSMDGWKQSS